MVDALRAIGCNVYRLSQPLDLLVSLPRSKALVLVEVKAPKVGRLPEAQKRFFEIWGGSPAFVVRTPEEAIAVVKSLDATLPADLEDIFQAAKLKREK